MQVIIFRVKEPYIPVSKIKESYMPPTFSDNIATTKCALVRPMHTEGTLYSTNFVAHTILQGPPAGLRRPLQVAIRT
jgi:hypothetical protein